MPTKAADPEKVFNFLTDDKLEAAGYPTEEARKNIRKDMIKVRISMAAQGPRDNIISSLQAMTSQLPDWLDTELTEDLAGLNSCLSLNSDKLMTEEELTDIKRAWESIYSTRFPLSAFLSAWPAGEQLLQSLKAVLDFRFNALSLSREVGGIFEELSKYIQKAGELEGSALGQLRHIKPMLEKVVCLYKEAGTYTTPNAYLKQPKYDTFLQTALNKCHNLFHELFEDRGGSRCGPSPLPISQSAWTQPATCYIDSVFDS